MLRWHVVLEATDRLLLGVQQPTLTIFRWVPVDKWSVFVGHDVTLAKPARVLSPDLKPEMTSLNVARPSGHCPYVLAIAEHHLVCGVAVIGCGLLVLQHGFAKGASALTPHNTEWKTQ